ncbi:hypothetical protein ACXIZN_36315 [Amycolatopsis sp. TRM77291]
MTGKRSFVAKILGNLVARIIAEWLKDLFGDLWSKFDRLWDEVDRFL